MLALTARLNEKKPPVWLKYVGVAVLLLGVVATYSTALAELRAEDARTRQEVRNGLLEMRQDMRFVVDFVHERSKIDVATESRLARIEEKVDHLLRKVGD